MPALTFQRDFAPETGTPVAIAPGITRVTAPNAGPYTFTGTNSFLLGHESQAVMDPGPDDEAHLAALLAAIGGRSVTAIILTHTHRDHSGLAARLQAETGAPLWFQGPHRLSRPLLPGERNALAGAANWDLVPDRVLSDGDHVVCAVTGERIPLHELRYWSVERQEPYADAAASLKAERSAGGR